MAAYSYWRLYITANNGDATYTDVNELEFRATIGGADQCSGGTAISGSYYGSNDPASAFDNNNTTYWIGQGGLPNYIGYHFSSAVSVAEVALTATHAGEAARGPRTIVLQASNNGTDWTSIFSLPEQTGWGTEETRTFDVRLFNVSGNITESLAVTKWRVTAYRCSTGAYAGSNSTTGSTYSVNCNTGEPCNLTIAPHIDRAWATGITPASGEFWVPSNPDTTPRLYECTTSGAVGGSEPTWPTSGTVNDGSAVWTFVANLDDGMFKTLGVKIPSLA